MILVWKQDWVSILIEYFKNDRAQMKQIWQKKDINSRLFEFMLINLCAFFPYNNLFSSVQSRLNPFENNVKYIRKCRPHAVR